MANSDLVMGFSMRLSMGTPPYHEVRLSRCHGSTSHYFRVHNPSNYRAEIRE